MKRTKGNSGYPMVTHYSYVRNSSLLQIICDSKHRGWGKTGQAGFFFTSSSKHLLSMEINHISMDNIT